MSPASTGLGRSLVGSRLCAGAEGPVSTRGKARFNEYESFNRAFLDGQRGDSPGRHIRSFHPEFPPPGSASQLPDSFGLQLLS